MTEHLRVSPAAVARGGEGLARAAAAVPAPPTGFTAVSAGDPLSAAAWAHQQTAETPVLEGLPQVQQRAAATAGKTSQAAQMYHTTDAELGSRLASAQFGDRAGAPASASPAAGGPGLGAAGPAGSALGAAAAQGAGADGAASQLGSLAQLASQAGQLPSQLGGALAAAPQSIAGAAGSAMGQLGGLGGSAGGLGGSAKPSTPGTEGAAPDRNDPDRAADDRAAPDRAAGEGGERAPVAGADPGAPHTAAPDQARS